MKVAINGTVKEFEHAPKLLELLEASVGPGAPPGVAVAINGEVVRRASWPDVRLAEGDEVEIVKATQGG
jgi:sulfur carrier protein